MKIYKLTTLIEVNNDATVASIKRLIDRDLNRMDGIYMRVARSMKIVFDANRTARYAAKYGADD